MPRACVLLANGFEEIEAVTLIDVLRRAEVEVVILGVDGLEVEGSHAIKLVADKTLTDGGAEAWDLVILPGGLPGAYTLRDNAEVQALIKRQQTAGRGLAAICAAPIALGKAGVLAGKRATCYPGFEAELTGAELNAERVVRDGKVFTSRGPGTAMEFGLALVAELMGSEVAQEWRQKMLVSPV